MANQKEAAAHLFIDPKTFRKLVSEGVLPGHEGRAGYDLDDCRKRYIKHQAKENARLNRELGVKQRTGKVTNIKTGKEDDQEPLSVQDQINAETLRKMRRENGEAEAKLAPIELLEDFARTTANVVRRRLEALPGLIKGQIPHLRGSEVSKIEFEVAQLANAIADFDISAEQGG